MNVIEIKGIVPGAGKTTLLVKFFLKSNLKNKIILTPSNKARQVCIQKLIEFGRDPKKAEYDVITFRRFKGNYLRNAEEIKFDIETGEEKESHVSYISTKSEPHFKKIWNIFIDEASMISDEEMKDLVENWRIQNLILDGDVLQFDPIGKANRLDKNNEVIAEWVDMGKPYELPIDTQILLNESMRAKDDKLNKAIGLIKEGKVQDAILLVANKKDCENKNTDYHIAYTNNACKHLNQLYENPTRWIVSDSDPIHGFWKSEILEENNPIDSERLRNLERTLLWESLKHEDKNIPTFEEWKERFLKPAYTLTCHKLQGSTIENGDIFIHLEDLVYAMKEHMTNKEDMSKLLQKYLYVAISRAINSNQISIDSSIFTGEEETAFEVIDLINMAKPMVDSSIKEDAVKFSAKNPEVLDYLINSLSFEIPGIEGQEDYEERISKAHSVKHKQHKQHKTKNYPEEMIRDAKTLKQSEWMEKYKDVCKSTSTYQKLKKR